MKQKVLIGVSFAAVAVLLSACGGNTGVREMLGLSRTTPDEFTVYQRAPLTLPPDYNLRPPRPGAPRPQESQPREAARQALLGSGGTGGPAAGGRFSSGERALLSAANATDADSAVRDQVDRETTLLSREGGALTEALMFWDTPPPYGTVVDPAKERKRIRDNQARGRPLTEGETPTIKRRVKGLLEDLVN